MGQWLPVQKKAKLSSYFRGQRPSSERGGWDIVVHCFFAYFSSDPSLGDQNSGLPRGIAAKETFANQHFPSFLNLRLRWRTE
jgi:hypothetical protein